MIEGLRLLPWVHWHRDKLADEKHPDASKWMDCDFCQSRTERPQRASMGCGWLPESERTGVLPAPLAFPEATVCPGYTVRLPEVLGCARMVGWADAGILRDAVDGPLTHAAIDGMDVIRSEIRSVERHALRLASSGGGRGGR